MKTALGEAVNFRCYPSRHCQKEHDHDQHDNRVIEHQPNTAENGHVFADDESRTKLVRVLRRLKPKVIMTHQQDDPHPDHNHIVQLVRESARLASMFRYDEETGSEKTDVPIVAHNVFSQRLVPSFVVDISDFLEEKMSAIRAHR